MFSVISLKNIEIISCLSDLFMFFFTILSGLYKVNCMCIGAFMIGLVYSNSACKSSILQIGLGDRLGKIQIFIGRKKVINHVCKL